MNKGLFNFIFLIILTFCLILIFFLIVIVSSLIRNRYKRLIVLVLAAVLLWGCFILFDVSDNSSQLRHHHLNQKNIEKVNFMVDKVFRDGGVKIANENKNDEVNDKSGENKPLIIDESNKAKLEKKLLNAINIINKDDVDKNVKNSNEKISITNEKGSNNNDGKKIDLVNLNNNPKKNFAYDNNILFNNNNNNDNRNNLNIQSKNQISSTESLLKKLERVVHIDLKGAPPKPDYFKSFIPFLKENGATGILLEYEDTFPFEGKLAEAKNGRAYTLEDVNMIKKLAKDNNLYIIPLVQTYGHLEWLLKVKTFAHLRDAPQFPQVISPCLNESYTVLYGNLFFSI
jgi:hypothetical protein